MAAAIHETGELPATADEVTDFLDAFAADALAKQRRTVARAVAKAAKRAAAKAKASPSEDEADPDARSSDPEAKGKPDFDALFGVS